MVELYFKELLNYSCVRRIHLEIVYTIIQMSITPWFNFKTKEDTEASKEKWINSENH